MNCNRNRIRTRNYYRKQRVKHIKRKERMINQWSYDYKKAKDLARIEAMNESEKYYQTYGYEFEDYELSDVEWNWIQVEEYWYYEQEYYYEWLDNQQKEQNK